MGRPVLKDEERRMVQVNIRLTAGEYAKVVSYASASGMTPANWIRQKAFTGKFPSIKLSASDAAVYRELHRIGVNLNQVVKLMNEGKVGDGFDPFGRVLNELLNLEKEIIKQLVQ
ncbi:MAG: hypothetical protein NVSMB24_38210 [Mucilaginibacter sp.]